MPISAIITPPATTQLTTIANVRLATGWTTNDASDAWVTQMIDRATSAIETALGRRFARRRVMERQRLNRGTRVFFLTMAPLVTLHAFSVDGVVEDVAALQSDSVEAARLSYKPNTGTLSSWPFVDNDPLFKTRVRMVEFNFEYTGGYLMPADVGRDLPPVVEAAAISMVQHIKAASTHDPLVASERIGDAGWTYRQEGSSVAVPTAILDTLGAFRKAA